MRIPRWTRRANAAKEQQNSLVSPRRTPLGREPFLVEVHGYLGHGKSGLAQPLRDRFDVRITFANTSKAGFGCETRCLRPILGEIADVFPNSPGGFRFSADILHSGRDEATFFLSRRGKQMEREMIGKGSIGRYEWYSRLD
jgi:hypothetical protein